MQDHGQITAKSFNSLLLIKLLQMAFQKKIYTVMFQVKCHTVHLVSIILLVSMVLMYLVQDAYYNYPNTNINPYSLPHYPEDPENTVYTLDGSTIEGVASGNYHIYESHSSGRDNDFRVTGEEATLLSDQVVELDAINPIGYSTQSETVPGGMVKLDAPIAEVLEIIPPEAFQVVDNGDETVTLTPFDDTDDDGIFDGAYADANNADAGDPVTLSKSAYDAAIGSSGNPIGVLPELNDWTDSGETLDGSVVYNLQALTPTQ